MHELVERLLSDAAAASGSDTRQHAPSAAALGGPDSAAIVALTTLLNQQRFAELEHKAARLAQGFPGNAFGWRMLGLALLAQGKEGAAIAPLREVAGLCPDDADNLTA